MTTPLDDLNLLEMIRKNRKGFEKWAESQGRGIEPSSEYSPQGYERPSTNHAFDGWNGRQAEIDALRKAAGAVVVQIERIQKAGTGDLALYATLYYLRAELARHES